jgi:putative transposase
MRQLRIIPKNGYIVVELSYRVEEVPELEDNGRHASIDLGVDILSAIYSNVAESFLISGGPLKSINHYYNNKLAELKSLLTQNENTVVDEMTGEIVEQRSSHATERL